MRAVLQRVEKASVRVEGEEIGRIGRGVVVFLGVGAGDGQSDAEYLAGKVVHLRVFEDEQRKMNLSLKDVGGEALVISQFTLYGDCRRGRRPSFTEAMEPQAAEELYGHFVKCVQQEGIQVKTGLFQALMEVEVLNYGPVTLLLDSRKLF